MREVRRRTAWAARVMGGVLIGAALGGCGESAERPEGPGSAAREATRRVAEFAGEAGDKVEGLLDRAKMEVGEGKAAALRALGGLQGEAERVVPVVIDALRGAPAEVLEAGAEALSTYGAAAVPALREALGSADAQLRLGAAWALERIGPPARAAADRLRELTNDASTQVAEAARRALKAVEGP